MNGAEKAQTAQVRDWYTPTELEPADFAREPKQVIQQNDNITPASNDNGTAQNSSSLLSSGMLDKLLPLIVKMNNGGLDITTVLDLLDKSGQGFGALGKLLPIIAPLLQNGSLGNLFSKKKSSATANDTIDYSTINLDS